MMSESYKKKIKELGLKQKYIAKRIGVSESQFSLFLNGERNLDYKRLIQLNLILNSIGGNVNG
jgi:transcriptional regulator with XRE-family HTH domain